MTRYFPFSSQHLEQIVHYRWAACGTYTCFFLTFYRKRKILSRALVMLVVETAKEKDASNARYRQVGNGREVQDDR